MSLELVAPKTHEGPRLDRDKWHNPLVSIIVTHYNYSTHIRDALLSLLDQTHPNWECVVVDDDSDQEHWAALQAIVAEINSPKIKLTRRHFNGGQIPAFYTGLHITTGEFVCLLDPDDRYAEGFISQMVDAHLNEAVYCAMVSSDQCIISGGKCITGIYGGYNAKLIDKEGIVPSAIPYRLVYSPAQNPRSRWTSTSAIMFRRPALELMEPRKVLGYKGSADSYFAQGAHRLGGSLYINQPLVYRQAHADNAWLTSEIFALTQDKRRPDGTKEYGERLRDVLEAIKANGGEHHLQLATNGGKRTLIGRLKRSLEKRLGRRG
jgi:glycosyltransferase involved in cell wall biosynthesis